MVEIFKNMLDTYILPIIKFTDNFIDEEGQICPIGELNSVYKFQNKKYTEDGLNGTEYNVPIVPKNDSDYIRIRKTEGLEIFNPFSNIKHMSLISILVKNKLEEYFCIDQIEDGEEIIEDASAPEFKMELISFYSVNEADGRITYVFSNNKNPDKPTEICRVTAEEPIEGMFRLCIESMKKCIRKIPKQYENLDKAWKYIQNLMKTWDKSKRKIAENLYDEHEMDNTSMDFDLTDSTGYDNINFIDDENMENYLMNKFGNIIFNDEDESDIDLSGSKNNINTVKNNNYDDIEFTLY